MGLDDASRRLMRVGIVGTGQVGLPLVRLLSQRGHTVSGYRRGPKEIIAEAGGAPCDSARAVADASDIVLTCLPTSDDLDEVLHGPQGLLASTIHPLLLVELSTQAPDRRAAAAAWVAELGGSMLDCPISGTPTMIAARSAVLFASGDRPAFEAAEPVLRAITDKLFFLGAFGTGTRLKFCANLMVAVNIMGAAEAMSLGIDAGLDGNLLVSALRESAGTSLQFQVRAPMMAEGAFDATLATLGTLRKDVALIAGFADALSCRTPLLHEAARWYDHAARSGLADRDAATIFQALRWANQVQSEEHPANERTSS